MLKQVILLVLNAILLNAGKDPMLYCDVCRGIVAELQIEIAKVPQKSKTKIVTSQSRLTSDGILKEKSYIVPLYRSRGWLENVLEETVCKTIATDYVKWFGGKDHRQWRIGRIMTYEGSMNTEVDLQFLQQAQGEAREVNEKDPNERSRNIRWYCESAVEELEDIVYPVFMSEKGFGENPTKTVCEEMAKWCKGDMSEELYQWMGHQPEENVHEEL